MALAISRTEDGDKYHRRIRNRRMAGFWHRGGWNRITVDNNTIFGCCGNGVRFAGHSIIVSGNKLFDNHYSTIIPGVRCTSIMGPAVIINNTIDRALPP